MPQPKRILDMTKGNAIRKILIFAVPLLIGNIFQQVYSVVDTMVAGYTLGDSAIAAIGATSSLYALIIDLAWGLNSGFSLVITQSFGAHDHGRIKKAIAGSMILNTALTLLLTVLALAFLHPLMRFMNTPSTIEDQAYRYMIIICAGMLATIVYNMFAGILRSFGNSRTPLYFLIFSCLLNIGLDILFVAGMSMGVGGAALATVIAQAVSGLLTGIYVYRNYGDMMPEKKDFWLDKEMTKELLSTGSAMAFMYSIVNLGSAVFQGAINTLDESVITAWAAGGKIVGILMQPLGTIMDASSTFVGQNWGARQYQRIKDTVRKVMGLEILWGLISTVSVYLFGSQMIRLLTGTQSQDIVSMAVTAMRYQIFFFPVLGVLLVLRTTMQAMGQKVAPVVSSGLELLMKFIAAVVMIPAYGFMGACINIPVTWIVMTLFLLAVYWIKTKRILWTKTALA